MKKILITYASYGSGHKTIAEYIRDYIKDESKYEIKVIDILDYTGKIVNIDLTLFDFVYKHRMENFFNLAYNFMDNRVLEKNYEFHFKHFVYNNRLRDIFCEFNPDIVISSHFYGSNVASYLKRQGLINPEVITIVTDYKIHKFWMSSGNPDERFIVANEIVKNNMIKRKCYSNNIYSFGLPYNEKLKISILPKERIFEKYNLPKNKKVILFFGGGSNGSDAYYSYLKTLLKVNLDYQIIFVCGKSEHLKAKASLLEEECDNLTVLGFVTNVYELLEISSIVITKPGGATVTECLEMQKFMLLIPGIGGQENYNAKFVSKNGYGVFRRSKISFMLFLYFYVKNTNKYKMFYNNKKVNSDSLKKIKNLVDSL